MILRPHVQQLLDPFQHSVIRELLEQQDAERLVSFMTNYPGTRHLLSGYGSFGGTTLTQEIVKRIAQRLASTETLITFRFDRTPSRENLPVFRVLLRFSQETLTLGVCVPQAQATTTQHDFTISEFLDTLDAFVGGQHQKSELYKALHQALKSVAPARRIMLVLDAVVSPETLAIFLSHPLFVGNRATLLVVVERETYNRWDDATKRFFRNKRNLQEWYIPCLWESEYRFVEQVLDKLFSSYSLTTSEAQEMLRLFNQHIVFIGRGVAGRALRELQNYHKYWQLDADTGQPFVTFEALDGRWLSNNAWLQDLLDDNWDKILGRNFPKRDIEDRAKQGVYALLDWIVGHATFSREDILAAAEQMPVIISAYQPLRQGTVTRLLDVLVANAYLTVVENEYDIIWGMDLTEEDLKLKSPMPNPEGIRKSLKAHLQELHKDYQAITQALGSAIGPVEQARLKRQAETLEKEIEAVKGKLSWLI